MTEREKIIDDLEKCLDESVAAVVPADTVRETIALLRAQEARVLTLDEVISIKARDEPLFLDVKGGCYYEWVYWYRCPDDYVYLGWWHGDGEAWECTMPVDEYGATWRCWTGRPTEKQMEVTKWE